MQQLNIPCPVRPLTQGPYQHFFGYYNRSPYHPDQTRLLALRAQPKQVQSIKPDDAVEIGLLSLDDLHLEPLATTAAWNWQQGANAQWLSPERDEIVFNTREPGSDRFYSLILNTRDKSTRRLAGPIDCLNPLGQPDQPAIGLNPCRLTHGHSTIGYALHDMTPLPTGPAPDDGLFHVPLNGDPATLLVSLADAAALAPHPDLQTAYHWFSHPAISPPDAAGKQRVLFIHRFARNTSSQAFWTFRLLSADAQTGGDLELLEDLPAIADPDQPLSRPEPKAHNISHPMWLDANTALAWAWHSGQPAYWRYPDPRTAAGPNGPTLTEPSAMPTELLPTNGHFSLHPTDPRWLLSDTYPDRDYYQHLFLYDRQTQTRYDAGRFDHDPKLHNDARCDLHPRWRPDGRAVCLDALAEDSKRQMYEVDLSPIFDTVDSAAG